MQFKNKLLSSVIASAVLLGTTLPANAVGITAKFIGTLDLATLTDEVLPFADEVAASDGAGSSSTNSFDDGVATVDFEVSSGTFPSGNVILQLALNGATFNGAITAANTFINFADCTTAPFAAVSIGGADGTNTITYVISNLNGCEPTQFVRLILPFDVNAPGTSVTLGMSLLTESGSVPVDSTNNQIVSLIVADSAFDVAINDAVDRTADVAATPPYSDFTPAGAKTLGDINLVIDNGVYVNLNGAGAPVVASIGDVTAVDVSVAGNFAGIDPSFDGNDSTVNAARTVASQRYDTAVTAPELAIALIDGGETFTVTPNGDPIVKSDFDVAAVVDLEPEFLNFSVSTPDFSSIVRNGTFATLPWTASNTQSGGTGSNNFVRVSNPTSSDYGPVTATILASTNSALVGVTTVLSAGVDAGGEVLYTAATLEEALGNFGRADIEIAVEGNDSIIKRLVQRTDGTYEINNVRESN